MKDIALDCFLPPRSPARKALAHVWRGDNITIISSPPGAGKTEIVSSIAAALTCLTSNITVASPTIAGGYDIAQRIDRKLDSFFKVALVGASFNERKSKGIKVYKTASKIPKNTISVRTVASCAYAKNIDILIVDEAYQVTALDLRQAASGAKQLLLVGDPGQIGPVVTFDTSCFGTANNPASKGPEVFKNLGASVVSLDKTFRLGDKTVELIAPLYDFTFTSSRPPAFIEREKEIRTVDYSTAQTPADPMAMSEASKIAQNFIGKQYVYNEKKCLLKAEDIAIIATRNEQIALLEALAPKGVKIGTADSLQGRQYPAVVAIDPLLGARRASGHALTIGRVCVMCSRHIASLVWLSSSNVHSLIDESDAQDKNVHHGLRERLGF